MKKHVFKTVISRRMPDPVFKGSQRHIFIVNVLDVPVGLPKDPNPRAQNTDRMVWREIRRHLLNREGTANTFHLKNKGITLLAADVKKVDGTDDEMEVSFDDTGHGIVDGGHTYDLVVKALDDIRAVAEDDDYSQFVKFEILVGYDSPIYAEVAGGLNTAIQVQEMSLANLRGQFDWVKTALDGHPNADRIAYTENVKDAVMDVRELTALMYLFNIHAFPQGGDEHPVMAYTSKSRVLDHYQRNTDDYKTLRDILPQILILRDTIAQEARELHNTAGGRAGKLAFIESRERGEFEFPFIEKTDTYRLSKAALYPMLGAFRWMVVDDEDSGRLQWRGGFDEVLALWRREGARLMRQTQTTSDENNRKVHAIGRSPNHWQTLYSTVAMAQMMGRASA